MLMALMKTLVTISTTKRLRCCYVMTELFDASHINDLIECMLAYIKAQTENPKFPESSFTQDKIMHLYINFHRPVLTRGGSYIDLPEWLKSKKAVINPQNKIEE